MPGCRPVGVIFWFSLVICPLVTAAEDSADARPPLKLDVDAAVHAAEDSRKPADVLLGPVTVRGKRRLADALPCIGCDGRQIVPMKRLQDFSEIIGSLLTTHPASRPDSPEDSALALAHEQSCIDGGFGCLLPK